MGTLAWGLLWTGLALGAVVVLALVVVSVVRRLLRLVAAVGDLFSLAAILDGVHRAEPGERGVPAVLRQRAESSEHWNQLRYARSERRRDRHEARIQRARALTSAAAVMPERNRV